MENERKNQRDWLTRMADMLIREMETHPDCPPCFLVGMRTGRAVNTLHETSMKLLERAKALIEAEDIRALLELEQYVKLVNEGIREYLARARKDGAP